MEFHNNDKAFRNWLSNNPEGFYINERSSNYWTLHKSECPHLPADDADKSGAVAVTTSRKKVFDNFSMLRDFLDNTEKTLLRCRTCNPE